MATLNFGEYRPDVSDVQASHSSALSNVLPRVDGYGPMQDFEPFTSALPARCRGFFFGTRNDGSISIFAGTSTKLYRLDNSTFEWDDVSLGGGTYSALNAQERWEFVQFNDKIIATQQNDVMQVFDIDSDTEFAVLAGSPPQAAHISIINRFVVASGIASNPLRVQWSALNDITGWTAGTANSDFQDLPDGGALQGTVGGELGIIIQEDAVRRMIFQPGSEVIFAIDRIANNVGCVAPHSIVYVNNNIFWLSKRGFIKADVNGSITFIGREKVDRTFTADFDDAQLGLVFGASDPSTHTVFFSYKSMSSMDEEAYDKLLAYDWLLDRWSPVTISGEFIHNLSQPGFTSDNLGQLGSVVISGAADNGGGEIRLTVASSAAWTTGDYKTVTDVGGTTEANGDWTITVIDATHIDLDGSVFSNAYTSGGYVEGSIDDDIPFSLDSLQVSTLPAVAQFNTSQELGFFTGSNLEATLESAEQSAIKRRMFIRGFYPVSDADDMTGAIGARENLNASRIWSTAQSLTAQGFVPARVSTRHARARVTIAAGDEWTYVTGVEPDVKLSGKR